MLFECGLYSILLVLCSCGFLRVHAVRTFSAQSMIETGEAMKQIADIKYALDDGIKQNFLEPLHHLQSKDLKEVMVS